MEQWRGRVAVVTGASSGIGAAIVKDLVVADLIVVGLARRVDRVEALRADLPPAKRANLHAFKCDVGEAGSVAAAFDWIETQLGGVDLLVNNAGCHTMGQLCTMDVAGVQRTLQTNVMGVVHCSQRAFASMKTRGVAGHVVLINSIYGHRVMTPPAGVTPMANIYCPTKFALTAINETYRQEFAALETKIKVTSISPGYVDTEMLPENRREELADCLLRSEDVSRCVLFAIATPPHVQIHELTVKPVGEYL